MKSDAIKKGPSRAPARAMLRATGLTRADIERPLVAVANTWTEVTPCNIHLRRLAEKVKEGIRASGGTPLEFNTIAVSDGISMGTDGMRASLISREVIADSIELAVAGHSLDAVVAISGCDKTIPATVMALARLDIPGVAIYGGSIQPGRVDGHDVTIQDVFEAVGSHAAGRMSPAELTKMEESACPGAGACGGQFTANTMATALTFLGISPMGANDVPANDPRKDEAAYEAGRHASSPAGRSRTPSLPSRPRAARRMRSCTCSRSRGRRAFRSRSTTSTSSRPRRRSWRTSSPGVASPRRTWTAPAARASWRGASWRPGSFTTR